MPIVEVNNLHKSYKKGFIPKVQKVLKGVSFKIQEGTVTGFLGGNGAGKTTTMKCMLGLAFPQEGEVLFFDGQPISSEIKGKIGFLPERPYFYDYLTGEEFLKFYGEISGVFKTKAMLSERISELLRKVDLEHARDKRLRDYSKGMLQKIGLAQALIHRPKFVILDEPMAGLDPDGRYYLSELIKETAKLGTSIFFSSHLLHDTEKLCKNLIVLKDGIVIYEGSTKGIVGQANFKNQIKYSRAGEVISEKVEVGERTQLKIDEVRKAGGEILSLNPEILDLEKAFINLAMNMREE